jgi:hypothetical protein
MHPGIYTIDARQYHADDIGVEQPLLSASIASILLRQSPKHAHAAHPKLGGGLAREESETFDLGTAAHSLILEGSEERYAVIAANDWRTNAAKDARDEARTVGKIPILSKHADRVRLMSNMVRAQFAGFADSPAPLTDGKPEQTLVWNDGGVWCKARVDWLHDDWMTIDDLKTGAVSAKPDAWTRTIYGRGGDVQAAFYLRGLAAITAKARGQTDPIFRWIVAENTYPFATSVVSLSPMGLAQASDQVEQAIQLWRRCLERDDWPGYPTRTCYVDPPAWSLSQWMEEQEPA